MSVIPAAVAQPTPQELALSGSWSLRGIGTIEPQLGALSAPSKSEMMVGGAGIEPIDTAGARVLHQLLQRLRNEGTAVQVRGLRPALGSSKVQGIGSIAELSRMEYPAIRKFLDGPRARM